MLISDLIVVFSVRYWWVRSLLGRLYFPVYQYGPWVVMCPIYSWEFGTCCSSSYWRSVVFWHQRYNTVSMQCTPTSFYVVCTLTITFLLLFFWSFIFCAVPYLNQTAFVWENISFGRESVGFQEFKCSYVRHSFIYNETASVTCNASAGNRDRLVVVVMCCYCFW